MEVNIDNEHINFIYGISNYLELFYNLRVFNCFDLAEMHEHIIKSSPQVILSGEKKLSVLKKLFFIII